jgi:APA family basic amino acid/polyamine antiporter
MASKHATIAQSVAFVAGAYAIRALYGAGLEANIRGGVLIACGIPVWRAMRGKVATSPLPQI